MRYRRQAYELTVPMADGPITRETLDRLLTAFHDKHRQTYGHASATDAVQLVNLRLTALGKIPGVSLAQSLSDEPGRTKPREVWFPATGFATTPVHWRPSLRPGSAIEGPAIIEALDSTAVLPPGWHATVDDRGYIRMRKR